MSDSTPRESSAKVDTPAKRKRRAGHATFLCIAPDECHPCRHGKHEDCSWDGEPDCLCKETGCGAKGRGKANLSEMERQMG